jgi:multidrug efflux pump subunit AcrA (membrane-fusion protein)
VPPCCKGQATTQSLLRAGGQLSGRILVNFGVVQQGHGVQVFTLYPGRIIALYASVGDDGKKGQTLFTIGRPRSPAGRVHSDPAAGVLQLSTRNLARLRELYKNLAISQRELDQATSDQQTAKAILAGGVASKRRLPQPPS